VTDRSRGEDPGDRIGRLYDEYAAGLYRYALMVLADPSAAADVVQQVFVAVLRAGSGVDSDERYLRRAVRNECYSSLRRRRRNGAEDAQLLETVPGAPENPEERIALEQALRALPPEQREVVHLKTYEGLTFQEIAAISGESINTVASRYRYALDKLREELK
jgi:RNA polymerase sigma-70 factor, ECF subfamily